MLQLMKSRIDSKQKVKEELNERRRKGREDARIERRNLSQDSEVYTQVVNR